MCQAQCLSFKKAHSLSLGSGGPEGASREEDAKVAVKEMGREGKSEGEELKGEERRKMALESELRKWASQE